MCRARQLLEAAAQQLLKLGAGLQYVQALMQKVECAEAEHHLAAGAGNKRPVGHQIDNRGHLLQQLHVLQVTHAVVGCPAGKHTGGSGCAR